MSPIILIFIAKRLPNTWKIINNKMCLQNYNKIFVNIENI